MSVQTYRQQLIAKLKAGEKPAWTPLDEDDPDAAAYVADLVSTGEISAVKTAGSIYRFSFPCNQPEPMTTYPYTPPKKALGRFRVALASTDSVQPDAFGTLPFPLVRSIKMDGIRVTMSPAAQEDIESCIRFSPEERRWCVVGEGSQPSPGTDTCYPMTRSLKDIPNLHVRKLLSELPAGVDGEIGVMKDGVLHFRGTTSAIMTEDGEPDVRLFLFDNFLAPGGKWERYEQGLLPLAPHLPPWCSILEHSIIHNEAQAQTTYALADAAGEEGEIYARVDGYYKPHRSTLKEGFYIKAKGKERVEITITGVIEEMENANEQTRDERGLAKRSHHKAGKVGKGRAGCLTGINEERWPGQTLKVASGLDDALKEKFWKEKPIGQLATIEFQSAGGYDLPRCPVYIDIRDPRDLS